MIGGSSFALARRALCVWLLLCIPAAVSGQSLTSGDAGADPLPSGALLRMGSVRLSHSTWLTSVEFSADDRWIGSADSNGVIRLWETATGKLVWEKPAGTGRTIAFSPDGKVLAIGGYFTREIKLWDLQKREEIRQLPQNARALQFSKDGTRLAAAGEDKVVRLWDPQTGKLLKEFQGHATELFAVAISPDGRWLASGGGNPGSSQHNEIRLWDIDQGKEAAELDDDDQRLNSLPDAIYSLEFSLDGKTLGAAGAYVVRLWDVERRKVKHRLAKCSHDVAFSPIDGRVVAPGDFGIYDVASGQQVSKLAGNVGVYGGVDYSHDGKLIVSGNMEGWLQLWNAETGKEIIRRSGHEGGIRCVAFSPDGSLAASVSRQDATIRIWGTASGNQLVKIPVTWRGPDVWWSEEGSNVLFAPYGREIATWTYDSAVRYFTLDNLESRSLQLGKKSATTMAFARDGTLAAVAEYDGGSRLAVGIFELDGGKEIASLEPLEKRSSYDAWVSALAFSPDGKLLAIGVLNNSLRDAPEPSVQLWDIKGQKIDRRLRSAFAPPGALCFSPDGTLLATSPVRGSPLQLWRVRDGVELRSFTLEADAHGRDPAPIAFSPDGKRLAAADANREIYVWELATGNKIKTFSGHQKPVTSIAFSPDGKTLLSGSEDATLLLWDVAGIGLAAAPLTERQLADYWDALASAEADIAQAASQALLRAPEQTVELLAARLTPGNAENVAELPKLIAELAGDDARMNLRASARLKSFGAKASPALFKALAGKPPLAARQRIEDVLKSIGEFPIPPEALQRSRGIELLEQIGSENAAQVLAKVAQHEPPTRASLDAKGALERLKVRSRAPAAVVAPGR